VDSQLSAERLDQLIRWHGTDETNLPHPDTLKHLARDTVAAIRELASAREKILELRSAMGRAFCAPDMRRVHERLLEGLGPPPDFDAEVFQPEMAQPETVSTRE
jgi:hypothetical protein